MGDICTGIRLTAEQQFEADCLEACLNKIVSTRILKRMTGNCISNILCERKLLPENCFKNEMLGTNNVKVLRKDTNNPFAITTNKWLYGILDALEKNYVSKVAITIFEDESLKTSIEKYIFSYKYFGSERKIPSNLSSSMETKELYNDSINIFESLLTTMSLLKPLPKDPVLSIYISYNDLAPEYYIAPNFEETESDIPNLYKETAMIINNAKITTPFHKMSVNSNFSKVYHTFLTSELKTKENILNCFCEYTGVYCQIISCKICNKYQHSCCYGKLTNLETAADQDDQHVCIDCYFINPSELNCTDMAIINFSKEKRKIISLIRRGLFFCLQFNEFSYAELKKYDGIQQTEVKMLLNIFNQFELIDRIDGIFFKINILRRDSLINNWFDVLSSSNFESMINQFDII